jgi:DNA-directed RNA polymerase subunit alpha
MIELENAQIESVELASETFGKYEASPLPAGYGVTLGNALRRVLLSSLDGAAVTSVQIRDVPHEFSTIPGVKEDVIEMLLNLKRLRLKSYVAHPTQLKLHKSGAGPVTAADISESADVEIVNPELHLLTLEAGAEIEMDLTVERGVGYLAAEETKELPIGVVPVDAIFTPIRRVDYHVENTRVGQMTNYDKLTLEIETDGTVSPEDALSRAAEILVAQFGQFTSAGRKFTADEEVAGAADALPPNVLDMPIEDLDLPMRAYNSLKRNNIVKVGQLLQLQDEDLLRMRNFGRKSLDEMKDRLRMRGFLPPEDSDAIDDLDLDEDDIDEEPFADERDGA